MIKITGIPESCIISVKVEYCRSFSPGQEWIIMVKLLNILPIKVKDIQFFGSKGRKIVKMKLWVNFFSLFLLRYCLVL